MSIHYTAHEGGYRYELPSKLAAHWSSDCASDADLEFLAEEAAADFHSEHDGWESQWPLTITLYDGKTGPELGKFSVEREYEPSFSAQVSPPALNTDKEGEHPTKGDSNG
jgi:hypothetical protein